MEKKKSQSEIIDILYKEIERKDKIIEKLREENNILLKTALRNAEKHLNDKEKENKKN